MKHLGQTLKDYIEQHHIKKVDVANKVGITTNYLSTIFTKQSIDCALFEKLCDATGLNPMEVFEMAGTTISKQYSDITASTILGHATVSIGEANALRELLDEKERLIQILLAQSAHATVTKTEQ